jgi:hypothetical protein
LAFHLLIDAYVNCLDCLLKFHFASKGILIDVVFSFERCDEGLGLSRFFVGSAEELPQVHKELDWLFKLIDNAFFTKDKSALTNQH